MKYLLLFISLIFIQKGISQRQLPLIKATSEMVNIREGNTLMKNAWSLAPQAKPDVYTTFFKRKTKITFYTDIDSISFVMKPNETQDFVILWNEKDSCFTQIQVRKNTPSAQFSAKYKATHKGKFSFEVPEVQELVHIIMALTPLGISDSNMVEHEGDYYKRVMAHFGQYKQEKIVSSFQNLLKNGNYAQLKMDACGFFFENKAILKDKTYDRLSWGKNNHIATWLKDLEEFALKTDFRKFYAENKPYYEALIALMNKQTPIQKQWDWLEARFPNRYDNYRITFSPLVNGSHSTNRFNENGFSQTVMFICGPIENSSLSETITEGLMTRVVFTEIDHNYVNPVSDKYEKQINQIFKDREKWTDKNSSEPKNYPSPYAVFNEYMTWATFALYVLDNYKGDDCNAIIQRMEKQIENRRGFSKFGLFNQKLMALYKEKSPTTSIADLYPQILAWCEMQ